MIRTSVLVFASVLAVLVPGLARAEEPVIKRYDLVGPFDFFATGATAASDGPDADANVDALLHPAITEVMSGDVPDAAVLQQALLYWGGSIVDDDCGGATIDDAVTFTPPGVGPGEVIADVCYCSDAASVGYDIQLCRADVTALIADPIGEYALDDFGAAVVNGSTSNASFSILLVFASDSLPNRRIAIYDGLLTMWDQSNPDELVVLDQLLVDDPPQGDLTWYTLEGDAGGINFESVDVVGKPGDLALPLGDAINPVNNPMNHTVNTTNPAQTDAIGVDIDRFDISAALSVGDTSIETTYTGGSDKYWIAYNVVGVNIFAPAFGESSNKTWILQDDADQDGEPSPGDTIRYVIHLENAGNAPGMMTLSDPIPAEAESWTLVDAGGGIDMSTADTLILEGFALAPGESTEVIFDVIVAAVPADTQMQNTADFESSEGEVGSLIAPPVPIAVDEPSDTGESDGTQTDTGEADTEGTTGGDTDDTGESGSGDGASESDSGGEASGDAADEVGESGESGGPGVDGGGDGCGCSSNGSTGPAALLLLLGLLGLVSRRR